MADLYEVEFVEQRGIVNAVRGWISADTREEAIRIANGTGAVFKTEETIAWTGEAGKVFAWFRPHSAKA